MTVADAAKNLSLKTLAGPFDENIIVSECYIGDLLSWVMGRAPADCMWITVMGNSNAVAVAKLADIAGIILCENATLDEDAKKNAEQNRIAIYQSDKTAFQLAVAFAKELGL